MRVFEALACGSLLVTNDLTENGQAELFQDGVHLATYREPEELLDKLAFYLEREATRENIAAAGRAEALLRHTYRDRMECLLKEAEADAATMSVQPGPAMAPIGPPCLQDPTYFSHARPELLALVPEQARRILDIGCGAGRLGEAIKARQAATVTGIELDPAAAVVASQRLDRVFPGDVEQLQLDFAEGSFDAIVCGDVLEHLREPGRLLGRARQWLSPDGCLIASIPNVRHHTIVRSLLSGNWTYESAGLLDHTHMRFFTRREIEKLFFRAGFTTDHLWSIVLPGDETPPSDGSALLRLGRMSLDGFPARDAAEFRVYQYLARARRADVQEFDLTSIVIVTHNQIDCTRQCLDSIRRLTDEPYEIIIVDNGSADGTVEYLTAAPEIRMIANKANRGFPAAANQGIAVARVAQVLLLNNDTIVTTGWLSRMLDALASEPSIGLVGPCSNIVSGPQQVPVEYDQIADLDGFAWDWGKAHAGQRIEVTRLVGFCMLVKRAVIDQIGVLDEQFGVGCFDDDDYCLRAIQAGFRAVIACDAFVHHHGGRTFQASKVNFGHVMAENRHKFLQKWSSQGGSARASTGHDASPRKRGDFAVDVAPGGGLRLKRGSDRPRLSLCMIVRNSARTLPACLASIRPWVDEMVVVNTGSVDNTPQIVEEFGGRLFHFPWCDDFSAARNESLGHARGDWLFWMDSDDTIPTECGRKLAALVDNPVPAQVLAFIVQVHCPGGQDVGDPMLDATAVDHVKLFRNRPDLRFDGRIHKQLFTAIRRAGGEVAWTDLYVVHSGSDQSPAAQQRKLARDLHLLELELAERPEHPFTLFNLGMTHVHASRFGEGAEFLRRGIARSEPGESHLRKAYALLLYAEMRLGLRDQALQTCRKGRSLFPHDAELRFREGVLLHELGRMDEARTAYLDVLRNSEGRHLTSADRALTGFKAHQNLAVIASDVGNLVEAEREWREVVHAAPRYRPGWRGLGEILVRQGRYAEAEALADTMLADGATRIEGFLLKSRVALATGRVPDARYALELAAAENSTDPELLGRQSQFLFEHGDSAEAEQALKNMIACDSTDASAHHNLGTVYLRTKRFDEAARSLRQSLRYRSNNVATYLNLASALKESGRLEEAIQAWEQVLRLAPGDPTARRADPGRPRGSAGWWLIRTVHISWR